MGDNRPVMAELVAMKSLDDELVEEGERESPGFGVRVNAGTQTRVIVHRLIERRRQLGLSQSDVAERIGTQQSAIARLETGGRDPKFTTVLQYAAAVGMEIQAIPNEAVRRRPGRPRKSRVA